MRVTSPWPRPLALAAVLALSATGCGPSISRSVVGAAMYSAHRPEAVAPGSGLPTARGDGAGRVLLAGDLHCHVSPPDAPFEADRGPAETVDLAVAEGLDFAVLTPHVGAGFFTDPDDRRAVLAARARLRAEIGRRGGHTTFIVGMEYTDHRFGHVGAAFADLEAVLADVPVEVAREQPARFFERFVARGGLLVVNHPLVTPLDSVISIARADLSWRPFSATGPFPPEIEAVDRLAQGFEAFNLTATHLRDRYLLRDTTRTIVDTLARLDREIVARGRRMTPVGGSDSHSHHLRATTFVWSRGRAEAEIREAIAEGRVCVRDPAACSLTARSPGGAWVGVGGAVSGDALEVRARGKDIEILVDGARRATPASGVAAEIRLAGGRCAVVRARVGPGYSAPIYANCPFAEAAR